MFTFYLVRHGETENNKKGKTQGWLDTPLTDQGLKNASTVAERLQGVDIDHVYSSDLGRAFITAHVIVEKLNIVQRLTRARELREINYGVCGDKDRDVAKREFPGYKTNVNFVFPDGESFAQMQKRVLGFVKDLEEKHGDKTVLLVTHAGVIRGIISFFEGWNFEEHLKDPISNEYIGKFVMNNGKPVSCERLE
jgi:phosphoserine phosphatase